MEEFKLSSTIINNQTHLSPQNFQIPSDWGLEDRYMCDLEMLLQGAYYPLNGFMVEEDYYSVLNDMRLASGELWPIPIVLPIPISVSKPNFHFQISDPLSTKAEDIHLPKIVRLRDKIGTIIAEMLVTSVFKPNLELEMSKTLGTTSLNHPYAKYLSNNHHNCYYIGGKVNLIREIEHFNFREYRLKVNESREFIKQMGWKIVIGFQTRNPMHRSHFELTQQAMNQISEEANEPVNLLLTPTIGPTQTGDIDYVVRVRSYKRILKYYNGKVKMILLPISMRMAGPREALWHALIRKNYGCTHFIVGRDHAGPSTKDENGCSFYGPYDAHLLLQQYQEELGITPIFCEAMVYVESLKKYVQQNLCNPNEIVKNISGTELRSLLLKHQPIPDWFSFPEVIDELLKFFKMPFKHGLCIYFTGLPCSGKSTLANAVEASILENELEERKVTLLDADLVRTHLSKGLGFTKEDRSINVRRIGYVVSEITKHGGICLVANIAPYEEDRKFNRDLVNSTGNYYVEVYVSTPLQVCEKRDVKELYKKARQGLVKQFTGISDPYQVPSNAELIIDSTDDIHGKVSVIMNYLRENSLIPS